MQVLFRPIWQGLSNSIEASRLRTHCERVFRDAGISEADNPATLKRMLARPGKLSQKPLVKETHPSMAFANAPAFYRSLGDEGTARLVKFYLLTAGGPRLAPYVAATWSQIDLEAKVWRVPGERTKAGRMLLNAGKVPPPFVIPLSDEACRVLGKPGPDNALVFSGPCGGRFYDVSLADFGRTDSDLHGLRSTFRSWVDTLGPQWYWPAEASLHHGQAGKRDPDGRCVGNQVSSYRKHDWLPERRRLLEMWAGYLAAWIAMKLKGPRSDPFSCLHFRRAGYCPNSIPSS